MNFVEIFVDRGVYCPSEIRRKLALQKGKGYSSRSKQMGEEASQVEQEGIERQAYNVSEQMTR